MRARAVAAVAVLVGLLVAPTAPTTTSYAAATDRAFTITDARITEASGLARSRAHPDVVWTVNDSGDGPRVYAVSTTTGATVGVHDFGAPVRDVEALAIGPDGTMYVADTGDNLGDQPYVRVFWFPEPALGDTTDGWASWELTYPDGPHDAEAFVVGPDGRMALVAKGSSEGVYLLPSRPSRQGFNRLTRVADAPGTVTDGVWLDDGRVVLRGYLTLWTLDPRTWEVVATARAPLQPQGEGIAAGAGPDTVLLGSEGARSRVLPAAVPGPPAPTSTSTPTSTTTAPATPAPTTPTPSPMPAPTHAPTPWALPTALGLASLVLVALTLTLRRSRRRHVRTPR